MFLRDNQAVMLEVEAKVKEVLGIGLAPVGEDAAEE
jgi:hypothetical protein